MMATRTSGCGGVQAPRRIQRDGELYHKQEMWSEVASSVTDNLGNRDNRRAGERRSKRKSESSLILWARRDTQAVNITSVTEVSRLSVTSFGVGCSTRQTSPPPQRALAANLPKRSL